MVEVVQAPPPLGCPGGTELGRPKMGFLSWNSASLATWRGRPWEGWGGPGAPEGVASYPLAPVSGTSDHTGSRGHRGVHGLGEARVRAVGSPGQSGRLPHLAQTPPHHRPHTGCSARGIRKEAPGGQAAAAWARTEEWASALPPCLGSLQSLPVGVVPGEPSPRDLCCPPAQLVGQERVR